ncbi:MAG: hypothetical protein GC158_03815 [Cyanobacteria bacterium RI_101]|nr:hypothetical protein [Cyanobacteria bacterium RI_101]
MDKVFEAIVETDGRIRITNSVHLKEGSRVFVSVPSEENDSAVSGLLLSEKSLANDWLNPEEDMTWSHR